MTEQAPLPLHELLSSRRSPAYFDRDTPVSDAQLELMLTAAGWSPSFGNSQPWVMLVARQGGPLHEALSAGLSRGNQEWVSSAPVVIIVGTTTGRLPDATKDPTGVYAWYDAGQAVAHLSVQARALGLQVHQFAGFDRDGVAAAAGVPGEISVLVGVAVGVPGDVSQASERVRERDSRPRVRKPLSDWVFGERWGEPWLPTQDAGGVLPG